MGSSSRPRPPSTASLVGQLKHDLALFCQSSELQSKQRSEQLAKLESTITREHESVKAQFDSVNQNLTALMMADGKLRADLEAFVLKHDAPKILVRLETVENKITALERRNDRLDGAAVAAKGLWFLVGGLIVGLLVAWLK